MKQGDPNVDRYAHTVIQFRRAILKAEELDDLDALEKLHRAIDQDPYSDTDVQARARAIARAQGKEGDLWPMK